MFEITVEDLKLMITSVKISRVKDPISNKDRRVNMKIVQITQELQDILDNANAITWYTGYDPKVTLTEFTAGLLRELKEDLC